MNVIFAGTPEFARCALEALCAAGHCVTLVLTQPDRPAGRGLHLQTSPVKQFALANQIPVTQPHNLRLDGRFPDEALTVHELLSVTPHEVMVVAAYGLILPQSILDLAHESLNIHASLLPRWRGAAPIQRAIEAGDVKTGISIMRMDVGLDTGPVLLTHETTIRADDDAQTLQDRLAQIGAQSIVAALAHLDQLTPVPQPPHGVRYAAKISKNETGLDFTQSAQQLANKIRAFNPYPGCVAHLHGTTLKIFRATVDHTITTQNLPGTVVAIDRDYFSVATGSGNLQLRELQKPGGKRLAVAQLMAGFRIHVGDRLT